MRIEVWLPFHELYENALKCKIYYLLSGHLLFSGFFPPTHWISVMKTSMNSWRVISTLREMQRKINWRHTFWIAGKKSLAGWNRITSWPYITQIDLSNFYNKNIKKDKIKIKKWRKKVIWLEIKLTCLSRALIWYCASQDLTWCGGPIMSIPWLPA